MCLLKKYALPFIVFALASMGSLSVSAEETHSHSHADHSTKDHSVQMKKLDSRHMVIKVQGMVCAFCAQGIEKSFNSRKEVKKTKVDLDKMQVTVTFEKGKPLPEEEIRKIITDAGFSFVGIQN